MNEAIQHFRDQLAFATDAWDLNEMLRPIEAAPGSYVMAKAI